MESPIQANGPLLTNWRGLTRSSEMPTPEMAQLALKIIDEQVKRGVRRYDFMLPMFPGDSSYKSTAPDETGAVPRSTAQVLGYKPEDFVQFVQ